MDIKGVISGEKFNQSISTKEICILVANDDLSCRNILVEMLQRCTYEVLYVGNSGEVVNAIWERKEKIGFIFTIVNRLNLEDFNIIQNIKMQFNLHTISMCPDNDAKIVLEGERSNFTAYIVKFLDENDVNNLLKSSKLFEKEGTTSISEASRKSTTPSIDEANQVYCKIKMRGEAKEKNEDNEDDHHMEKKPRVVWTKELHEKFLRAINILGHERAIPKKILEVMNVPNLTRENVASHLQKHRMGLKRSQEYSLDSTTYGMNLANDTKQSYFSSSCSFLNFNSSRGYSHLSRYSQPGFFGSTTHSPTPRYSFDLDSILSTYRSNSRREQDFISQAPMNQLFTPSALFPSGNLQCIRGRNFRVYNDQKKNVLYSIKSGSSTIDATPPTSTSDNSGSNFLGFRLNGDGKSIGFGERSSIDIKLSDVSVHNCSQLQPITPPATMAGNESNYSEDFNLVQLSPLPENFNFQQESPLTSLWNIPEDQYEDHFSSAPVNNINPQHRQLSPLYQAPGDYTSAQSSVRCAATFVTQHQPSAPTFMTSEDDQTTAPYSSRVSEPYLGIFSPPSCTLVYENTFQDPASTYIQCVSGKESSPPPLPPELHEINSFTADGDLDVLLNAPGSPGTIPESFWEDEIDNLLYTINAD